MSDVSNDGHTPVQEAIKCSCFDYLLPSTFLSPMPSAYWIWNKSFPLATTPQLHAAHLTDTPRSWFHLPAGNP